MTDSPTSELADFERIIPERLAYLERPNRRGADFGSLAGSVQKQAECGARTVETLGCLHLRMTG